MRLGRQLGRAAWQSAPLKPIGGPIAEGDLRSPTLRVAQLGTQPGDGVILCAGVPFGTPGTTNVLHVVRILGNELKNYQG